MCHVCVVVKGYDLGCEMHDFHDSLGLYVSFKKDCFPILVESSTFTSIFPSKRQSQGLQLKIILIFKCSGEVFNSFVSLIFLFILLRTKIEEIHPVGNVRTPV